MLLFGESKARSTSSQRLKAWQRRFSNTRRLSRCSKSVLIRFETIYKMNWMPKKLWLRNLRCKTRLKRSALLRGKYNSTKHRSRTSKWKPNKKSLKQNWSEHEADLEHQFNVRYLINSNNMKQRSRTTKRKPNKLEKEISMSEMNWNVDIPKESKNCRKR